MDAPKAWIITVGNEILIGRIVNTNASYLARRLTFLGFSVDRIVVVPDSIGDIAEEVARGLSRAKVVVTTGGLGPTYDDVTLEGIAKATGRRLVLNEDAVRMVREFYSRKGLELTEERLKMAKLPEGGVALPNPVGAAPGLYLELPGGRVVVALPGVPREMEAIFEGSVVEKLRSIAPPRKVAECGVVIRGVPESTLAPVLEEMARKNPSAYIKSHPKGHEVDAPILDVRVMASAIEWKEALKTARSITERIAEEARRLGGEAGPVYCEEAG